MEGAGVDAAQTNADREHRILMSALWHAGVTILVAQRSGLAGAVLADRRLRADAVRVSAARDALGEDRFAAAFEAFWREHSRSLEAVDAGGRLSRAALHVILLRWALSGELPDLSAVSARS